MSLTIGGLNVRDVSSGYFFEIVEGGPYDYVAEVSGERVLIPGAPGYYTTSDAFEERRLTIRVHGWVGGAGSTTNDRVASYASRFAALKSACDVANRQDVTIVADDYTIEAGFLRIVGPPAMLEQARELEIEFEATNPPAWEAVGS